MIPRPISRRAALATIGVACAWSAPAQAQWDSQLHFARVRGMFAGVAAIQVSVTIWFQEHRYWRIVRPGVRTSELMSVSPGGLLRAEFGPEAEERIGALAAETARYVAPNGTREDRGPRILGAREHVAGHAGDLLRFSMVMYAHDARAAVPQLPPNQALLATTSSCSLAREGGRLPRLPLERTLQVEAIEATEAEAAVLRQLETLAARILRQPFS